MHGKPTTALFLRVAACAEAPTGLLLLTAPTWMASVLLGAAPDSAVGVLLARLAGAALLALGIACWTGSRDAQSWATAGLMQALLVYNLAAAGLLTGARFVSGLPGMGLLPVAGLHAGLAVWCVVCIRETRRPCRPSRLEKPVNA